MSMTLNRKTVAALARLDVLEEVTSVLRMEGTPE